MYSVEYFPHTREDLHEIEVFLDSIDYRLTNKILNAFKERIQVLCEMPLRYSKYLYRPEYRVLGVHNYSIFYTVNENNKKIEIRRILHSARNIELEINKK